MQLKIETYVDYHKLRVSDRYRWVSFYLDPQVTRRFCAGEYFCR